MMAVLQRVAGAKVLIDNKTISSIGKGLLVFLGIGKGDQERDCDYLVDKILHLRVFEDFQGKMNLSLLDIAGEILVVSQFTLLADCRKGRRPSFTEAEEPELARKLYLYFINKMKEKLVKVAEGEFQATMQVKIVNDGPVTIILNSRK